MRLAIYVLLMIMLTACAGNKEKETSLRSLEGSWVGEYLEKDGTLKRWKQIRRHDGEYVTFFGYKRTNGQIDEFVDSGKWWVEGDLFHEINPKTAAKPFVYRIKFYKSDCIRFEQVSAGDSEKNSDPYIFTECKIDNAPTKDKRRLMKS